MKGIGVARFKAALQEAINEYINRGDRAVTKKMYGYRFWVEIDRNLAGNMVYTLYGMTDESYQVGVINGSLVGKLTYDKWEMSKHFTLYK